MGAFPRSIGIVVTLPYLRSSCSVFKEPTGSLIIECCGKVAGRILTPIPRSNEGRAYSSVGSERTPDKREVGSSNLPRPTMELIES